MSERQNRRATDVVRMAQAGELGQAGVDLVALLTEGHKRGQRAEQSERRALDQAERIEREANALAAVLADLMDGAPIDPTVDDLPYDARRRVLAYRHQSAPIARFVARDQFGRLPQVPPRASVMRDRVRVVDVDLP
jgi:hypothetical protein